MRWWMFAMGAVVLGLVLGLTAERRQFGRGEVLIETSNLPDNAAPPVAPKDPSVTANAPRLAVLNGEDHDFGQMKRWGKRSHTFIIANQGKAPLELRKGTSSCKCTFLNLEDNGQIVVQPGEEVKVDLEWSAKTQSPQFRQTAEIHSNDPDRPVVQLITHGYIVETIRVEPAEMAFGNVLSTEPLTKVGYLLDFGEQSFQVTGHQLLNEETAEFFQVEYEPITPEEASQILPLATTGVRVKVTMLPGLPNGAFQNTIVFETDLSDAVGMELPVTGNAISDITVIGGPRFRTETSTLVWDGVPQAQGASERLAVVIKGQNRENVHLSLGEVYPADVLKVELGEPKYSGKAVVVPLIVSVPANAPLVNCMGGPNRIGEVLVETNHPTLKQLRIPVRFAVQK